MASRRAVKGSAAPALGAPWVVASSNPTGGEQHKTQGRAKEHSDEGTDCMDAWPMSIKPSCAAPNPRHCISCTWLHLITKKEYAVSPRHYQSCPAPVWYILPVYGALRYFGVLALHSTMVLTVMLYKRYVGNELLGDAFQTDTLISAGSACFLSSPAPLTFTFPESLLSFSLIFAILLVRRSHRQCIFSLSRNPCSSTHMRRVSCRNCPSTLTLSTSSLKRGARATAW